MAQDYEADIRMDPNYIYRMVRIILLFQFKSSELRYDVPSYMSITAVCIRSCF